MNDQDLSLDTEERHFFKTVYNAAFANPFSRLRERLDQRIAGLFPTAPGERPLICASPRWTGGWPCWRPPG